MGKLVKYRKSLLILLLTLFCFNFIWAQNGNGLKLADPNSTEQMDESNIVFSDDFDTDITVESTANRGSTVGFLIRMIIVLIIVIAIIYFVFWFFRKKTNIIKTDDDFLRRVAYINLGPGKTVEVVTLIDKAYLIGVTESNITLLGEIDDKELINAMNVNADKNQNTKKPLNFNEVLDIFTAKGKKNSNIFSANEKQVENLFSTNEEEPLNE